MKRFSLLLVFLGATALFASTENHFRETGAAIVFGIDSTDQIAFHGATPVVRRAGAAQAAVTATVGAALATTGATTSTPYGFSQAQADGLIARVNGLIVDNAALIVLVNEQRAALVEKGLIKGAP